MLVLLLIGGSPLISLLLLASALMLGWLMLLARLYVSLSGLLVGWILLIGPPRRLLVLYKMSGMFTGMNLVRFLGKLCLLLGMLSLVHLLMIFGLFRVGALRRFYFGPILEPVVPLPILTTFGWNGFLGVHKESLGYARARLSVFIQVWTWSSSQTTNSQRYLGWGYWFVGQGRTFLITLVW